MDTKVDTHAAVTADADEALVRSLPGSFENCYAEVNGVRLHYVAGGEGEPLVLLPGWPQTWWAFHKVLPALADRYRVIVVDLRGMGGSDKPGAGYDKKTMASDVHALVRHLGYQRVDVIGHDIGAMVAHSFAVNHPAALRKLGLMDVVHPDDGLYHLPILPVPGQFSPWWWAFNQVPGLPEQLLAGRARYLVDTILGQLSRDPGAIDERDRQVYAGAYDGEDAIRAGSGWYQALGQDIADNRSYGPVTAPVLGLAGEDAYEFLAAVLPSKATDVRVVKLAGSGHFLAEERPDAFVREVTEFLG